MHWDCKRSGGRFRSLKADCTDFTEKLKDELTSAPVMAYFDTKKETVLTVDASPIGILAILSQRVKGQKDPQVVAYASIALTTVQKRYSQTEKESSG